MKAKETHNLNEEEIRAEEQRLRRELYDVRTKALTEKLENSRQVRNIRRDIARILTEIKLRSMKKESA
jgi:large subunit ribosomal protein L29